MKISVADLLIKYIENECAEYIFGTHSKTLTPLFKSLENNNCKIKPISVKHEGNAAFMADGYARIKGSLGVCFGSAGSGITNLVTGIASSYADSIPLLALTGQVSTKNYGKGSFQDSAKNIIDSISVLDSVTKYNSVIINKYKADGEIQCALKTALTGRKGPVHLSLPVDVLEEELDESIEPVKPKYSNQYFDRQLVIEASQKLVNAKCPVILAGAGAVHSKASSEIIELAEMLGIPVASTPKAKGVFPEKHPLSLGIIGFGGSPVAEEYIKSGNIDVLLVIGASLNEITAFSFNEKFFPADYLIHINIDPAEIGKNYKTEIPLIGDANTVVNEIGFRVLRYMDNFEPVKKKRIKQIQQLRAKTGDFFNPEKMVSDSIPIKPQRIIKEIEESLPENSILFADTGIYLDYVLHYLKWNTPGSFICATGLGAKGYGISAAIGGKLAAGKKTVVSITDNACFLTNGMEISTAVNYDIPVIWIIQNNVKSSLIDPTRQKSLSHQSQFSGICSEINFCKIAEGLGAAGYQISKPGELKQILPEAISLNKPVVIDCLIDPDEFSFYKNKDASQK